jgi:hypothetical protein
MPLIPTMAGRAAFFMSLGFRVADWHALAAALGEVARNAEVAESFESIHGQKYVLDGPIQSPSGRMSVVRTIWIIDRGEDIPRLITAYPHQ